MLSSARRSPSSTRDADTPGPSAPPVPPVAPGTGVDPRFAEHRATGDRAIRAALIEDHRWLARHCARRFTRRGVPTEDLVQVAMVGLVKAVDRFVPDLGWSFTTFAVPTITGELRRHFRDCTWAMRVRRRAKENHLLVRAVVDELQQELGRSPTIAELADRAGLRSEETIEALDVGTSYRCVSLDIGDDDEDDRDGQAHFGVDDAGYTLCEARVMLPRLLALLGDRERRIIELRFVHDMSQSRIADEIGLSQVHVSRLLRDSLALMREHLTGESRPRP